ncbi:5'/3'-nucleotidase SurE [Aspergillus brunneoviolaceus CBS 621.78]|uniref:Sure-like protein n=1 Tax=Aspergillus brunneoviolaceus CBS 621.78 TaxID=1450534 RepID=A0ACD1GAL8_9EURO|nr:sure-like protein [Aspergillus brunneoviolaceus CBS 621.78]RAH46280.1 sure-like protein [Aspergillus brunneoviolaceus CBS 621.78]
MLGNISPSESYDVVPTPQQTSSARCRKHYNILRTPWKMSVVNDDGPPSRDTSPYVHSLVHELQTQGHIVTVVLPNQQRSWIGKAHFVGEVVKATYLSPGELFHSSIGVQNQRPWMLVNSTPAGCEGKPIPIDLVVSGPNLGANATALFSLSSGTIGGGMEAVLCGKRSIALSFEPATKHDVCNPVQITDASRHAIRLIEHLYRSWDQGVELYSVNIPLQSDPSGDRKVVYTRIRPNRWLAASPFQVVSPSGDATTQNADSPLLLRSSDLCRP